MADAESWPPGNRPAPRSARLCPGTAGRSCRHSRSSDSPASRSTTSSGRAARRARRRSALRQTRAWWLWPNAQTLRLHALHLRPGPRKIALDLARAQRRRQPRVAVAEQQRPDADALRGRPTHPRSRSRGETRSCQSRSRLPSDGHVGDVADRARRSARCRRGPGSRPETPAARRPPRSRTREGFLERRVVAVHVRTTVPRPDFPNLMTCGCLQNAGPLPILENRFESHSWSTFCDGRCASSALSNSILDLSDARPSRATASTQACSTRPGTRSFSSYWSSAETNRRDHASAALRQMNWLEPALRCTHAPGPL